MSTQKQNQVNQKLSVNQVADEFGCHPNTVWNHIRTGRLPAVRFGPRLIRVNRSDLDRFISLYRSDDCTSWLTPLDDEGGE